MKQAVALIIAGALAVTGFAPLSWFPLCIFSLAYLFYCQQSAKSARVAAVQGLLWGLGFFIAGVSWVYVSLHVVGGMPALVAGLMTFGFCLLLALFPAVAAALNWRLTHTSNATPRRWLPLFLCAATWVLAEWLRGTVFTGFPWLALGYSQAAVSPLSGYAPVLGVYGVSFFTALVAVAIAALVQKPRAWMQPAVLVVGSVVLGGVLQLHHWTQPIGQPFNVSLLQGNVPQTLKWEPAHLRLSLDTYAELAQQHPAPLIVLPETAIPLMFSEVPKQYFSSLAQGNHLLLGAAVAVHDASEQKADGYANGAILITPSMQATAYFKRHLVPFGEYAPPGFRWFFDWARIPMADFTAGPRQQNVLNMSLPNGDQQTIAANICYEDLFGEELIHAVPDAGLLINLSNTAWFGDSLAQPQHFQIAQMRAIETGRMMLRSTNTGMTGAVNPDGSIAAVLPAFTRDGVTVKTQAYRGITPYVALGNLPLLIIIIVIGGLAMNARRKDRKLIQ